MKKGYERPIWLDWATYIVLLAILFIPAGIGLVFYTNNIEWITLSVLGFIFIYAG